MIKRHFIILCITFITVILAVSTGIAEAAKSRLDIDYGTSYKLSKYNQILNPDAEKNLEPVEGLDGVAAGKVMNKYRESFSKPKKAPVYNLSIGGK